MLHSAIMFIVLFAGALVGATEAVTDMVLKATDGRMVELKDDDTWKYQDAARAASDYSTPYADPFDEF